MDILIFGHHPDLFPGFNALMSVNFAYGFAMRGHAVTLVLPETERFPQRERLGARNVALADLDRFGAPFEILIATDGKIPGRHDIGVWQSYFPEDEAYWSAFRNAVRLTTKNFPRLFTGVPERDGKALKGAAGRFDVVGVALKRDLEIVRSLFAATREAEVDRCRYTPRGFRPDWFDAPESEGPPVIGVEKGVKAAGDEYAYLIPVVDELRRRHGEIAVIGARVNDARLVTRSVPLLPARRFYREFLNPLWAYAMIDVNASYQGVNAVTVDGRTVYPGLYENQIIEAQMAGAAVVGHRDALPDELVGSPRTGFAVEDLGDVDRIVAFLDAVIEDRPRRAAEARAWAIANHSVGNMVDPILEAAAAGNIAATSGPPPKKPWWRNEYYSQFGEDAVLHAYFRSKAYGKTRSLDEIDAGFFVDIGCHHPHMLSNTWFFYQRGWRGINVDPTPGILADFSRHRPEDQTFEVAVSEMDGEALLISYGRNVGNTIEAERVRADIAHEKITVPTVRLDTLLDRHMPLGTAISILSVDVEGHDLAVLRSNDWTRFRPEMVVVELHANEIQVVLASELHAAMIGWEYRLHAWVQPSLIYRRQR